MKPSPFVRPILALAAILTILPSPAYAYIDPGTGALFLQVLGAAAIAVIYQFRRVRDFIARFFRFGGSREKESASPSDKTPE